MGLMGHGIVQTAAEAGFNVVGVDAFPDAADKAMARIRDSLDRNAARAVKKGGMVDQVFCLMTRKVKSFMQIPY